MSAELNTPVFEAVKQQPERSPTPENKRLSKIPIKKLGKRIFDFISIEQQATKTITIRSQEQQRPEQPSTPEGKDLSPIVKQLDQAAGLANNGYVKELKQKNFPDIPKNQLMEMRFLGYTTRIGRIKFIAINTKSDAIRATCQNEINKLMKKRDKEFEKQYEGIIQPPQIEQVTTEKQKPQQNNQDGNNNNPFGYL